MEAFTIISFSECEGVLFFINIFYSLKFGLCHSRTYNHFFLFISTNRMERIILLPLSQSNKITISSRLLSSKPFRFLVVTKDLTYYPAIRFIQYSTTFINKNQFSCTSSCDCHLSLCDVYIKVVKWLSYLTNVLNILLFFLSIYIHKISFFRYILAGYFPFIAYSSLKFSKISFPGNEAIFLVPNLDLSFQFLFSLFNFFTIYKICVLFAR